MWKHLIFLYTCNNWKSKLKNLWRVESELFERHVDQKDAEPQTPSTSASGLIGNRVFADVTHDDVLEQGGTPSGRPVTVVETEALSPPAKGHQLPPGAGREAWTDFLASSGGGPCCWHLAFGSVASQTERINFCCYKRPFVALCYGSPRKRIHNPIYDNVKNRMLTRRNLRKATKYRWEKLRSTSVKDVTARSQTGNSVVWGCRFFPNWRTDAALPQEA